MPTPRFRIVYELRERAGDLKRPWQFSLKQLFVATTAVAVWAAWFQYA